MPKTETEQQLRIDLARERFTSSLIEHGVARASAEAHASSATYHCVESGDDVLIIAANDRRAFSNNAQQRGELAAELAKTTQAGERSTSTADSNAPYDPVAEGKKMAAVQKRSEAERELARR